MTPAADNAAPKENFGAGDDDDPIALDKAEMEETDARRGALDSFGI